MAASQHDSCCTGTPVPVAAPVALADPCCGSACGATAQAAPPPPAPRACCAGGGFAVPSPASPPVSAGTGTVFRIRTMDCPVEENEIRRALEPLPGIRHLRFQLGARTLTVDAAPDALQAALAAIRAAGFDPQPVAAGAARTPDQPGHSDGHGHHHDHDHASGPGLPRLLVALALAIGAEAVHFMAPEGRAWQGLGLVLAAVAIWLSGVETYTKGFQVLRRGRLNINALMCVAVTGAVLIGQWPEAAMVMALYAIAEFIEARAADRARHAIEGLLTLAPEQAEAQQPDGSWQELPAREVAVGAVVRIRPGARVPLDGVVMRGTSTVDQSPITGESLPVDKAAGDGVYAGTINATGELEVRVTAEASNTTLARIIHAVEAAQGNRAPTQRFVDRFAAGYTPAVFAIAVGVAVAAPMAFGLGWIDGIYKALVLLVVACPCALVISTPVTVVSALAAAARRGILIKGGTFLEDARLLKVIALDKTGTLTEGRPKLVAWSPVGGATLEAVVPLALGLARRSDHPVARAIAEGLAGAAPDVLAFQALPGRGVQGMVGGRGLVLGNHRLVEERGQCTPDVDAMLRAHEAEGRTVTLLADDTGVLALFAVADTLKAASRQAVAELVALGVTPVMLSGDNHETARAVARQAGMADATGNLLPEDKLAAIEALQQRHGRVGMTGDGINDAPALARADIGFAMGAAGTDIAMEAADVVVMNDDLRRIPETIRLSRATHAVLWQNISLALGIKAVFMGLALFGTATMWMAVFADMGATLLVVANGLRLLRVDVSSRGTGDGTAR